MRLHPEAFCSASVLLYSNKGVLLVSTDHSKIKPRHCPQFIPHSPHHTSYLKTTIFQLLQGSALLYLSIRTVLYSQVTNLLVHETFKVVVMLL